MVINGSDLFVYLSGGAARMLHGTSYSIDMKMNPRNTSNKDTGKFNTKGVGRIDITASCDHLMVYADIATVGAAFLARTPLSLAFGEQTGAVLTDGELVGGVLDTSKDYITGSFIITGLTQNAPEDNASYSVSFENADGSFAFHSADDLHVFAFGIMCSANAASDGLAAAFPSGGTAPYTYLWADAAGTTQTITSLDPGTYTVTVTDDDSATATASVVITEPAA
jgi:hypothetical protein